MKSKKKSKSKSGESPVPDYDPISAYFRLMGKASWAKRRARILEKANNPKKP